jgi:hypothetical protein
MKPTPSTILVFVSISCKNETNIKHISFYVSRLFKNEVDALSTVSFSVAIPLKIEIYNHELRLCSLSCS